MSNYIEAPSQEVYVLCKARTEMLAAQFLDKFLPHRVALQEDYPFPELVDKPEVIYSDASQVMRRLVATPEQTYSFYWRHEWDGHRQQAMLFYTSDGGMIAGLANFTCSPVDLLQELAKSVEGKYGLVTCNSCPPECAREFVQVCRAAEWPRLIEGRIVT